MRNTLPKPTTIFDRFKNAIRAFKGKPYASIQFGIDVKRCDDCPNKIGDAEILMSEDLARRLEKFIPAESDEDDENEYDEMCKLAWRLVSVLKHRK